MEKFGEKLKTEAREEPEETEEELETSDSLLEKGIKEKTIKIPEIGEIKYFEKEVKFPEHLVAETGGVKGYTRKTIPWGELIEHECFDKNLSKEEIKKYFELLRKNPFQGFSDDEKIFFKEKESIVNKINFKNNKIIKISLGLTEKKFPCDTFLHAFEGYWKKHEKSKEQFKTEKLLLQKIFSPLTSSAKFKPIEEIGGLPRFRVFDGKNESFINNEEFLQKMLNEEIIRDMGIEARLSFYKLNGIFLTGEDIDSLIDGGGIERLSYRKKKYPPEKINQIKKDYKSRIINFFSNKELFFMADGSAGGEMGRTRGLSVWNLGTPEGNGMDIGYNYSLDKMMFGFGRKNKAFTNYLKKVKDIYKKNKVGHTKWQHLQSLLEIPLDEVRKNAQRKLKDDTEYWGIVHPSIPIVLNRPDIHELRWCHADYASIPTKRGWNIIEMVT